MFQFICQSKTCSMIWLYSTSCINIVFPSFFFQHISYSLTILSWEKKYIFISCVAGQCSYNLRVFMYKKTKFPSKFQNFPAHTPTFPGKELPKFLIFSHHAHLNYGSIIGPIIFSKFELLPTLPPPPIITTCLSHIFFFFFKKIRQKYNLNQRSGLQTKILKKKWAKPDTEQIQRISHKCCLLILPYSLGFVSIFS